MNLHVPGARPSLDRVQELRAMEEQALYSAAQNPGMREVAHRLVATSFYFKKDGGFQQDHGVYTCKGTQSRFHSLDNAQTCLLTLRSRGHQMPI